MREFLRAKIHGAIVTQADVEYEGSFGIDSEIMQRVGILPYESVEVYNVTTGGRLRTYAIPLPAGSRRFESNGAAAHTIRKGDRVILACYQSVTEQELQKFSGPKILILDEKNQPKSFYQADVFSTSSQEDELPPFVPELKPKICDISSSELDEAASAKGEVSQFDQRPLPSKSLI